LKNLYKRIGAPESHSKEQLALVIQKLDAGELRLNCEEILLVDHRKSAYDQCHRTLLTIGHLRDQLNIKHVGFWARGGMEDYLASNRKGLSKLNEFQRKLTANKNQKEWLSTLAQLLIGGTILVAVFYWTWFDQSTTNHQPTTRYQPPPQQSPIRTPAPRTVQNSFNEPALTLPSSGFLRSHTSEKGIAPLRIETRGSSNYLVKLENQTTGLNILDVFVRGGEAIEIEVPLGNYIVKYASGRTWYGYQHLFGPQTRYSAADSVFRFNKTGNQISGYTITLFNVANGNLETRSIPASQF